MRMMDSLLSSYSSRKRLDAYYFNLFSRNCWLIILVAISLLLTVVSANSFDPYELNGGLVSAVVGKEFCIVAADTRMIGGGGYHLASRNHLACRLWTVDDSSLIQDVQDSILSRITNARDTVEISSTVSQCCGYDSTPIMVASAGCSADCEALKRVFRADLRAATYVGNTKALSAAGTDQVATLLSQILYLRRGFPYYSFCVVAGIDQEDGPKAYVYDAIGSYEQVAVATAGTGRELLQPILDRAFVSKANRQVEGTAAEAIVTLSHAYRSVSEREIGVGDNLVLCVIERASEGDFDRRIVVIPLKEH